MRRVALYTLFFLSGVTALIYELTWQRLLDLVFGVSTLSVSAVLAAFMGGLALGGLLMGRVADRTTRPLRWYAWIEVGIGLSALLVPSGFALLTGVYTSLYTWLEPNQWEGACLRFGLALVLLGIPATLLGATVPIMGRLALRRCARVSSTFSLFYAVNTLGGVLGASLTGFLLLRILGMQQTLWLAAGVNFLVASAAGLASLGAQALQPAAAGDPLPLLPVPSARPWLVLACAALTGLTCTGFEVAWMRILGILTSNSAYGFALMLTVMLLGLCLGSFIQAWWSRRPGDSWRRLACCQVVLAAATLTALPFFRTSPEWLNRSYLVHAVTSIFFAELALTASALFLPAVCMGMSLPLLVECGRAGASRFGQWLGRLYALNTLGCVAGPFLVGFVLIPWLGIRPALGTMVAVALLVGLCAWACAARPVLRWRCLAAAAVLLAAGAAWIALPSGGYHKSPFRTPRQLLYHREGNNATVAVVQEASGRRTIMVDSQPVAGTGCTDVVDQKMLAHLPLLLHPAPRRALTVGFGSGGTSHSMTLHGIDVDCVEIEAMVPGAASYFRSENQDVLVHPRFHLILDDARSYLRVAPVGYDVIVTDCTNIQYRSNGDLYTVEYFRLMKDRLSADGLAAAWVPANGIGERDLKTLLRSFQEVFPHTTVWFMNTMPTDFLILVGTPGPLVIDLENMRRRMDVSEVAADLARVGMADPCRLLYTFLTGPEQLRAYLGPGPLNTDDRPVLSYSTYGANCEATIAGNLLQMLACRSDVTQYVKHPADEATMLRHYLASNEAILGHIAHQVGSGPLALMHYLKGAELLPEDAALHEAVMVHRASGPR